MAGFLDDIDTSSVKYTENYKPIFSKSTTMRVDTNLKKRLSQMALDQDTSIKAIVDNVLNEFLEKKKKRLLNWHSIRKMNSN
jgi:predicted HicB family RNase H-like nuclease